MTININKCPLLGEGNLFGSVSTCQGNSSFFCTGRYIYISSFRLEVFKSFPSKNLDLISLPADVGVIIFTSTRGSARQIHTWRDVACLSPSRMESVRLVSLKLSNLASAHSQHLVVRRCSITAPNFQKGPFVSLQSECWKEENGQKSTDLNWSGELFGSDSRCFFSTLARQVGVGVGVGVGVCV